MRNGIACFALALVSLTGCAAPTDDEPSDAQEQAAKKKDKDKDNKSGNDDKNGKPQRFTVIQHNIGGGAENVGTADGLTYTIAQIDEKKPDVVMLEEMCTAQVDAFRAHYPGWDVHFTPMRDSHPGCANQAKGQVLASPRALEDYHEVSLLDPDGEKRFTLSCGGLAMPKTARSVLACVTHLHVGGTDPDGGARTRQAERVAKALAADVAKGRPVVVAGDLNTGPDKPILDSLYRLTLDGKTNGGSFDEADQTDPSRRDNARTGVTCADDACRSGAPTTSDGPKLDYVFFSHNRAKAVGAQAFGLGGSHHKLYYAWSDLDL